VTALSIELIVMFSLLECRLPVPLQFSQNLLVGLHNVPGAFVWSENAKCIFCSNSGECNVHHPMHFKVCPCALFIVMAKHAINGELSCDQRRAVNNAGGYVPYFYVICHCVVCDVVPAV
jgi:hypothetical protein